MTDPERPDGARADYNGCPHLAWLPWWRAGVAYAELADVDDDLRVTVRMDGAEVCIPPSVMSLYHFFLFWGFSDGRL